MFFRTAFDIGRLGNQKVEIVLKMKQLEIKINYIYTRGPWTATPALIKVMAKRHI